MRLRRVLVPGREQTLEPRACPAASHDVLPHHAYPDHAGLATGFVAKDSRAPAKPEQRVVAEALVSLARV